jgi:hypothetical protein
MGTGRIRPGSNRPAYALEQPFAARRVIEYAERERAGDRMVDDDGDGDLFWASSINLSKR